MERSNQRERQDFRIMVTQEQREVIQAVVDGISDRLSVDALRFLLSEYLPAHEFMKATACVDELMVYRLMVPLLLAPAAS